MCACVYVLAISRADDDDAERIFIFNVTFFVVVDLFTALCRYSVPFGLGCRVAGVDRLVQSLPPLFSCC